MGFFAHYHKYYYSLTNLRQLRLVAAAIEIGCSCYQRQLWYLSCSPLLITFARKVASTKFQLATKYSSIFRRFSSFSRLREVGSKKFQHFCNQEGKIYPHTPTSKFGHSPFKPSSVITRDEQKKFQRGACTFVFLSQSIYNRVTSQGIFRLKFLILGSSCLSPRNRRQSSIH